MTIFSPPSGSFDAVAAVPGDKSLGHRALIFAAVAPGRSRVQGLSRGEDIASTRRVLAALGVEFDEEHVASPGRDGWQAPVGPLDCGNSGTTMRLMAGALAPCGFDSVLTGDDSLSQRPMQRLVDPLGALGASIGLSEAGTAPVSVGGRPLVGAEVTIPVATAQVRTAVALAALAASSHTTIESPPGFRDHTERWLETLGRAERTAPTRLVVHPGSLPPIDIEVPGDPSSAAFLWAAAAVRPGSRITTPGLSLNPGRLGFLRLLEAMGAAVEVVETGDVLGDPIGDVTVAARPLRGIEVGGEEVAAAIDELPLLAVVAAIADGETVVRDARELRIKESDRLAASVELARLAGAAAYATATGFVVGSGEPHPLDGIESRGDHRIAMSAAIAAIVRDDDIAIGDFEACAVSWPEFAAAVEGLWS